MRKCIIAFTLITCICIGLLATGCAKVINTEETVVPVTIMDSYHRAAYTTPMCAGKVVSIIHHPAIYRIYVEYMGVEYAISGSKTYHAYKDRIGDTVNAVLETRTYDDGSIKYDILSIG